MSGEAPDIREQGDCPGAEFCDASCDQHAPTPCPTCGGAGIVDTSPPGVEGSAP